MELLTDPWRVAAKMHVATPTEGPDLDALDTAIEEASGIILNHLNRDSIVALTEAKQAAVMSVATRVAMRLWRNPADLSSESFNEHSVAYSDPRILTGDEVKALSKCVSRVRGPIFIGGE